MSMRIIAIITAVIYNLLNFNSDFLVINTIMIYLLVRIGLKFSFHGFNLDQFFKSKIKEIL